MKSALVLALLAAGPPDDGWFGVDKVKHFFASALVQSLTYASLRAASVDHGKSLAGATAVTAAVGIGRELHDRRTTGLFSVRDLVWDGLGAGAATLLLERTER